MSREYSGASVDLAGGDLHGDEPKAHVISTRVVFRVSTWRVGMTTRAAMRVSRVTTHPVVRVIIRVIIRVILVRVVVDVVVSIITRVIILIETDDEMAIMVVGVIAMRTMRVVHVS